MRKFLLSAVFICALFIPLLIPLSLIADCSYDQNSNISTIFIPGNGEVKYTYDPINRLTSAKYSSGKFFHYSYDYNSNITAIEGLHGRTSYTYAFLDRLEKAIFPDGNQILYQYDCMGRLTQLTYPDGEEVEVNLELYRQENVQAWKITELQS
jgi:YD repeat-containing protein